MIPRLMPDTRRRIREALPVCFPALMAGMNVLRRRAVVELEPIDPLAERCGAESLTALRKSPPRVFEAYLCLEIAAAREPSVFGAAYRCYRDRIMRAVLGTARSVGLMANVEETTLNGRWVGRDWPGVRAELRGHELRVVFEDGQVLVLERDLGMEEGCDA